MRDKLGRERRSRWCRGLFEIGYGLRYCSDECKEEARRYKGTSMSPNQLRQSVCREIGLKRHDPDSIMDLIEDWTGIRCPKMEEPD